MDRGDVKLATAGCLDLQPRVTADFGLEAVKFAAGQIFKVQLGATTQFRQVFLDQVIRQHGCALFLTYFGFCEDPGEIVARFDLNGFQPVSLGQPLLADRCQRLAVDSGWQRCQRGVADQQRIGVGSFEA